MASFSQRKGYKPTRETVQFENMDDSLRIAIWNCFHNYIFQMPGFRDNPDYFSQGEIHQFAATFWADFLKKPVDTCPYRQEKIYEDLRNIFFRLLWYEVYDFVEFVVSCAANPQVFVAGINSTLETEMAAYRLLDGKIVDRGEVERLVVAQHPDAVLAFQ